MQVAITQGPPTTSCSNLALHPSPKLACLPPELLHSILLTFLQNISSTLLDSDSDSREAASILSLLLVNSTFHHIVLRLLFASPSRYGLGPQIAFSSIDRLLSAYAYHPELLPGTKSLSLEQSRSQHRPTPSNVYNGPTGVHPRLESLLDSLPHLDILILKDVKIATSQDIISFVGALGNIRPRMAKIEVGIIRRAGEWPFGRRGLIRPGGVEVWDNMEAGIGSVRVIRGSVLEELYQGLKMVLSGWNEWKEGSISLRVIMPPD